MADEPQTGRDPEVPDEYAMRDGRRPDSIRRRNRITGILLLLLIALIVGITIWSRASGDAGEYSPGEPAEGLGEQKPDPNPER